MAQLQGQVSNTFADVQAQPNYQKLPSDIQAQIALDYFDKRVATQQGYQQAPPEAQQAILQDFRLKYNVPDIKPAHTQPIQPRQPVQVKSSIGSEFQDFFNSAINTGSAGIADLPVANRQGIGSNIGAFTGPLIGTIGAAALAPETGGASLAIPATYMGLVGAGNTAREQYRQTGRINNPLAVGTSGATNAALGLLGPVGKGLPLFGRVAANAALQGGAGAAQDAAMQAAEQQNFTPQLDTQRLLQQALIGGGLGGGFALKGGVRKSAPVARPRVRGEGVMFEDFGRPVAYRQKGKLITQGQKLVRDTRQFIKQTDQFKGIDVKATAQTKTKAYKQAFDVLEQRLATTKDEASKARIRQAQKLLQERSESTKQSLKPVKPEKIDLQEGTEQFNNLVEYVTQLRKAGRQKEANVAIARQYTPKTIAKIYDAVKRNEAQTKQQANIEALKARQEQQSNKALTKVEALKRAQELKQFKEDIQRRVAEERAKIKQEKQQKDTANQIFGAVQEVVKRPQPKQGTSTEYVKSGPDRYSRMAQDAQPEITNQQKLQALKAKQAQQTNKTINKEQALKRAQELKQLKAGIQKRANEQKAQAKQQNRAEQQAQKAGQKPTKATAGKKETVKQSSPNKLKQIRVGIDKNQTVRLEYLAEKSGETSTYRYKEVTPLKLEVNKNGVVQLRAINDEGQPRTYLLADESGSKIESVQLTGKSAPHQMVENPKTGKQEVQTIAGQKVKLISKEGVKSSEIRANLEKMQDVLARIKQGEKVTPKEIMEAAKPMTEKDFLEQTKGLDDATLEHLGKEVDC